MISMETKTCTKCGIEKPIDEFRELRNSCKDCNREYGRAKEAERRVRKSDEVKASKREYYFRNADKIKGKNKSYYETNKEKILAQVAEYRDKNRERINAWMRTYYRENIEIRKEKDKEYNKKNKDKRQTRDKQYRQEHRAEIRLRNRSRKEKLSYVRGDFTQADWDNCLSYWGNRCAICGRTEGEGRIIAADHWIPLKGGGITHKKNILPLCHGVDGCNNSKSARSPEKWTIERLGESNGTEKLLEINRFFDGLK